MGDEKAEVGEGDLVYIPANEPRAISNTGDGALVYVSAATPAFSLDELYDAGDLSDRPTTPA